MNIKQCSLFFLIIILGSIFCISTTIAASEDEWVDPDIPDSWNQPPKTASEMGITEFDQSPMLDNKVKNGQLPVVKERLPKNPIILEPYDKIGKYGGTAVLWDTALDNYELSYWNNRANGIGTLITPDAKDRVPFFLKGWEYSEDYKKVTLQLREGLKWSDGEELTADDYVFWWKYYANREELEPVSPEDWDPPLLDVTKEDNYTVIFHFGKEYPTHEFVQGFGMMIERGNLGPSHYMEQFHPDFVGEDKVLEMAEEAGLDRWEEYYSRIQEDSPYHPEYRHQRPVLSPYIATERKESVLVLERNPYFPMIDTEGNQLPYIDKIRVNLANEAEMAAAKATTGEATLAGRHVQTKDIPLYKQNEEKGEYKTLLYPRAWGSEIWIIPNLSAKDSRLRKIFLDDRFRKALSLAINREDINNKVYYGHATPRQATVLPDSKYFEKEFAEAYAEYNPERAKKYLDDMGMIDTTEDGFRDGPDGEPIELTLTYGTVGPLDPTKILELLKSDFQDIGLNFEIKMVGRGLLIERLLANELDLTVWSCDFMTPYISPYTVPRQMAPPMSGGEWGWMGYIMWFRTKGEEGIEPPEEIKKLHQYYQTALFNINEEERDQATKNLLQAQAENLWKIGTVGMGPQPLLISNKLKNVPKKGYWDAGTNYLTLYRPWQFYLEE